LADLRWQIINDTVKAIPSAPLSAFATCQVKPALGASMSFLTDCTIFLSKAADLLKDSQIRDSPDKVIVAEVWRSRLGPAQSFTVFRTVSRAVEVYLDWRFPQNGIYLQDFTASEASSILWLPPA
jgi:hypothetical protein